MSARVIELDNLSQEDEDLTPFHVEDEVKKGKKRPRKQVSDVWAFYRKISPGKDGKPRCKCKNCGKIYGCDTRNGTTTLIRHSEACPRRDCRDIGQMIISQNNASLLVRPRFSAEKFRELLTAVVIKHDLPFQFIEWSRIKNILLYLRADLHIVSRNTIKADCLKMYKREKNKVKDMLMGATSRVCLTSDCWTSMTTDGYICLTAHFIDQDWTLQKRILNFCFMPPPHTGVALSEKILWFVNDWMIHDKIFSITLDNASVNDVSVSFLKNELSRRGRLLVDGKFFHVRCAAHILNLIVQDGLKSIDTSVCKVRETVKYVKGSQSRKQRFLECVAQVNLNSRRGLRQDVMTRWNSTFLMLDSACYFREALLRLSCVDDSYKHYPSEDEWKKILEIRDFLSHFYKFTLDVSATKSPTSNLFFPGVCSIYVAIKEAMVNSSMMDMAALMYEKFMKYWADFGELMAMAVIVDPRYKLAFVEYSYKKMYETDKWKSKFEIFEKNLNKLFKEYSKKKENTNSFESCSTLIQEPILPHNNFGGVSQFLKDFKSIGYESSSHRKSQLDLYLEEPRYNIPDDVDSEFDVLSYWKTNSVPYPKVAAMALDILSFPLSSVASESAFTNGGKVLDQFRSSLKPDIVQALVCTKDWLFEEKVLKEEFLVDEEVKLEVDQEELDE